MARHGRGWYRVLYVGDGAGVRPLGRVDESPTRHPLTPFLSRLLLDGAVDGELVLVEEATGRAVARRPVRAADRPGDEGTARAPGAAA
jgi:hypothetical protein